VGLQNIVATEVVSGEIASLPPSATVVAGSPSFVSSGNNDYHLTCNSLGTDFASSSDHFVDLDGNPRVVDLPFIPNRFGPQDLGALESPSDCVTIDPIFLGGFEPSIGEHVDSADFVDSN
jgi:hypothetical protein